MTKQVIIVDGTAQIYRAFYAIKPLNDSQGRMVNAVFGFAQIISSMLAKFHPSHLVVVFDRPEPTHRHEAFPEYKAQREAAPEDLVAQIPLIQTLLAAFQIRVVEQAGWEADDLIATLAKRAEQAGFEVRIFSNDKDLFQLVNLQINILRPRRGQSDYERLDPAGVETTFGVAPDKVIEVLSLMGDTSDNIPGVPGVGPKTAVKLIQSFGSVAELYRQIKKAGSEKLQENLIMYQGQVARARELVTIRINPDLVIAWEECQVRLPLPDSAGRQLAEFGFKRMLENPLFAKSAGVPAVESMPTISWAAGRVGDTPLSQVCQAAWRQKQLAIEKTPEGLALSASAQAAAWIPIAPAAWIEAIAQRPEWVQLLCDPEIRKIGYDLKPLARALYQAGLNWQGPNLDLHLAAHFLDLPTNRPQDFISRWLGAPVPETAPGLMACAWWMIADTLPERIKTIGAASLFNQVELPLVDILAKMEAVGVALDVPALETMSREIGQEMEVLEKEVQTLAGIAFNLRSTQQLAEVLFDRLGLSPGKKTKTGRSTDSDVLENLALSHPLPQKLLDFRQLQKLKSTYLDVLPGLRDPRDQRVHTTFHQVGAATGRFSCSDPNLQNIPIRTERGRLLRQMFVPGKSGECLLSADYSQIELRLLAHLSQDPQMLEDFAQGVDIHRATAADIFSVPLADVTSEMRRQAKTCNFGIAYGVSPYGLSRQLRIPPMQAKVFIDGFYARYPLVKQFLDQQLAGARQNGYVSTFMGRRRPTPDVTSANRNIREAGERMAINMPIQGAAADIIKTAMVSIDRELANGTWQSQMILQVHDELLFEGPEPEMPALQEMVVRIMSTVCSLRVPLAVEAAWGKNWMEAHA